MFVVLFWGFGQAFNSSFVVHARGVQLASVWILRSIAFLSKKRKTIVLNITEISWSKSQGCVGFVVDNGGATGVKDDCERLANRGGLAQP